MAIESLQALVTASENRDICDVIIESDCVDRGVTQAESLEKMRGLYAAIRRAQRGYDPKLRSASGMVGGDGEKMRAYVQRGKTICGDYIGGVIAQALEMGESNACMKCIVAAPTAGSCGVLPAVLLPYQAREGLDDNTMVRAMYVAGAIGQVVAAKASIAGAAGGCQAEIGTATAMGAAAQWCIKDARPSGTNAGTGSSASSLPPSSYPTAQPKAASRAAVRFCGLCMALPPFCLAYLITAAVERASILRSAAPNVAQPIDFARRVLV